MGIKGIYSELGPGKRVSLTKLTANSFRDNGRPLRVAVDFAIWQFQNQAARGGSNPAIRTLFYRLVRLLSIPIQPIFVFDGPHKPSLKRNKRSARGGNVSATQAQAKQLMRLFGCAIHDAPGEAEAECALLQRHGIVDAVLSEDVDTIMFGCTRTIRNWAGEGSSKPPTHVTLYDKKCLEDANLDRAGMILVALMSGGDYLPDGIPGCGVKVAYEAAKAGFGQTICRLRASDSDKVQEWRKSLNHELRTNESNYFRTKHKALTIPGDFPNFEVLRFYTHPVVSPESTLDMVRKKLERKEVLQLEALREFTRETFDWDFRIGALKFIRVLGPALLMRRLVQQTAGRHGLTLEVSTHRQHFNTDGERELRLSYIPSEVVPIDLSEEVDQAVSREGLAFDGEEEVEALPDSSQPAAVVDNTKDPVLVWVLDDIVRTFAPATVSNWEEACRLKAAAKKSPKKKSGSKATKTSKAGDATQKGAIEKFFKVTKQAPSVQASIKDTSKPRPETAWVDISASAILSEPELPPPPSSLSPLSSSKAPALSRPHRGGGHAPSDHWTSASSQRTPPRTSNAAIIISSSPPQASSPPLLSTPRTRTTTTGSEKEPGSVHAVPSKEVKTGPSESGTIGVEPVQLKATTERPSRLKGSSLAAVVARYTQTSIDKYTTRGPLPSSDLTESCASPHSSLPVQIDDDSEDGLSPPPSSSPPYSPPGEVIQKRSPGKREKHSSSSDGGDHSPTPAPKMKKKLFIPRTSDVGFFKEVEVEVDERDERVRTEGEHCESSGFRGRALRRSDLSFIDLTQED